ncbi:MAG: glycosyltransferase family 2 protein [Firmicutes bacterium]|nr:glycosyltransferase family 2 protein [Bacillota bacterium]
MEQWNRTLNEHREFSTELSIVIPAHNEAPHIGKTLAALEQVLAAWRAEVIVVDDGSTDSTVETVQQWIAGHPASVPIRVMSLAQNVGKGMALCYGTRQSQGRWVAWIDADGDIHPQELVPLVMRAKEYRSVVVGSKQDQIWTIAGIPWWRRIMSRTFAITVKELYHLPIHDTQTGCKVFPGSWLREAIGDVNTRGFLMDVEVLVRAHRAGIPLAEMPVQVNPQRTVGRISLRHVLRSLHELWIIHRRLKPLSYGTYLRSEPRVPAKGVSHGSIGR